MNNTRVDDLSEQGKTVVRTERRGTTRVPPKDLIDSSKRHLITSKVVDRFAVRESRRLLDKLFLLSYYCYGNTVTGTTSQIKNAQPLTPAVFHILFALADGPLHGYAIMQAVDDVSGPGLRMGPGTIYGSIQRMEEAGLVRELGSKKRRYALTSKGRKALRAESERLAHLSDLVRAKGLT